MQLLVTSNGLNAVQMQDSVAAWGAFLNKNSWQEIVAGIKPEACGCGLIYEMPNILNREGESFAIADMRMLPFSEPHYHSAGVTEIYFVLEGEALVVVGGKEHSVKSGDVIVTPPLTAHYVIPRKGCVLGVVNIPAFRIEDYHVVTDTNLAVGFDKEQFTRLTSDRSKQSKKIYVAAKFSDQDRVKTVYDTVENCCHVITHKWVYNKPSYPFADNPEFTAQCATDDINGVLAADVFILLSHSEPSLGASAELGAAIASLIYRGKPDIFVIGPHFDENFAFWHPHVQRVASVEDVIDHITRAEK